MIEAYAQELKYDRGIYIPYLGEPFKIWINPSKITFIRWSEEYNLFLCVMGGFLLLFKIQFCPQ